MPNDYMIGFLHCGLINGNLVFYSSHFNLSRKKKKLKSVLLGKTYTF